MNKKKTFFDVKASVDGKSADVFILGEITPWAWEEFGEMSSVVFKEKLDAVGDVSELHIYVNSPGGSVFEGIAIGNMLKRHKGRTIAHVDALAASIASDIVACCDEVRMPSNAMLMIHNAMTGAFGNSSELRKVADDLDRINGMQIETYMSKIDGKTSQEEIQRMMDEETWLSAQQAYDIGLCDVVEGANRAVACLSNEHTKQFKNLPKALLQPENEVLTEEERQNIIADSKANLTYLHSLNLI